MSKRAERRNEAQEKLEEAKELQNIENIQRFKKRLVKVTRKHNEDCKKLLQLLGIPVIQAPSEAEAQCAQLCREGLVYAVATEDMDALTLGCPRLIRNLTSANNEKIKEFHIEKVLNGLGLNQEQFIDLSILMGCDYCDNIRGIGGKKGLELVRKYNNIESILKEKFGITEFMDYEVEYNVRAKEAKAEENTSEDEIKKEIDGDSADIDEHQTENDDNETKIDESNDDLKVEPDEELAEDQDFSEEKTKKKPKKQFVPENWAFLGARKLFQQPLVLKDTYDDNSLKQKDIDEEGLIEFLCKENGFSEDRVKNAIKRAKECKNKSSQTRIDSFFKLMPSNGTKSPNKRNLSETNKKTSNKRGRKGR